MLEIWQTAQLACQEDILRLQVSVQNLPIVHVLERQTDLGSWNQYSFNEYSSHQYSSHGISIEQ